MRKLATGLTLTLALLLMLQPMGHAYGVHDAVDASALPHQAYGRLGVLDTAAEGPRHVHFDTTTGTYAIDGEWILDLERRDLSVDPNVHVWAFDFEAIFLGPETTVTASGERPLTLLSRGPVDLAATIILDGLPGADAGKGAGGGGGGGGGALAVLALGAIDFSGAISAHGGAGGIGNIIPDQPVSLASNRGGDGGAGTAVLASLEQITFGGTFDALPGGWDAESPGDLLLAGQVVFDDSATIQGVPPMKAPGLHVVDALPLEQYQLGGGGGGAGAGGSGLFIDEHGMEVRDGHATQGGLGGLGGAGGGAGGAGSYAVAGGGGGQGGSGGSSGTGAADAGGAGGGGGGGGAYEGPGGPGGNGGQGVLVDGFPGGTGESSQEGDDLVDPCGLPFNGGKGAPGGNAGVPSSVGAGGGSGGTTVPGGSGLGGGQGNNGLSLAPGVASANGGGGGGGGGANGGAGGHGGKGGNGHENWSDGGGGGGGGGGGADSCLPVLSPGTGGNGGAGGNGTSGGTGLGEDGGAGHSGIEGSQAS
ncbi:MAG: hypothetical protein ACPHID_02145 [Thermoplasmatota archaeon]